MSPVLYLVMRNDIESLNPGKLAAQAAHCANAAVAAARRSKNRNVRAALKQWEKESKQDFGTTIVLAAPVEFFDAMQDKRCHVYDDTYPAVIPRDVAELLDGEGSQRWSIHIGSRRCAILRRELVGCYALADEFPEQFNGLELYP